MSTLLNKIMIILLLSAIVATFVIVEYGLAFVSGAVFTGALYCVAGKNRNYSQKDAFPFVKLSCLLVTLSIIFYALFTAPELLFSLMGVSMITGWLLGCLFSVIAIKAFFEKTTHTPPNTNWSSCCDHGPYEGNVTQSQGDINSIDDPQVR